jgi:predicted TIM-barrel fold metal-dependent hydrolase
MSVLPSPSARRIDMHVHVVGNGTGGTGCWYRPQGFTKLGAPLLVRAVGLPSSVLTGDLDGLYAARLLELVRGSSLDAVVILAQEDPYTESGERITDRSSFYVPNEYVLSLARRHPELLPAVSIHPARRDALEELERCLAGGAVMLKCLPNCQNIDWNDRRYTAFLERMAAAGLPLLAHTGSERTMPVLAPHLASPRMLTRALEIGVTCVAAHCGTGTIALDPDYFEVFVEMARRFPNLHGDNSALAGLNFRFRPSARRRLLEPWLAPRILHGSDLPVPSHGTVMAAFGMIGWSDYRASRRIANPLERDVFLKRALGFPEESFTAVNRILRRPSRTSSATIRPT